MGRVSCLVPATENAPAFHCGRRGHYKTGHLTDEKIKSGTSYVIWVREDPKRRVLLLSAAAAFLVFFAAAAGARIIAADPGVFLADGMGISPD